MLNTIFGIVGWIGTLLVFAGVAIRLFRPEWDQYAYWAAVAGLVCVGLYTLTQWREIGRSFQKRETKLGAMMSISVIAVLAILIGVNWAVARRDKRWDLTAAGVVHAVGSDRQGAEQPEDAGQGARVRRRPAASSASATRSRCTRTRARTSRSNTSTWIASRRARANTTIVAPGTVVMEYDGPPRERDERARAGTDEHPHQGHDRPAGEGVFRPGARREGQRWATTAGYASVVDVLKRDNYTVDKIVLAQAQGGVPADASVLIVAGPTADYLKPEVDAIRTYLRKGGKALFLLDPPVGEVRADRRRRSKRCSRNGASPSDTTSSSTSAAWASCSAPTRRFRSSRAIRSTR